MVEEFFPKVKRFSSEAIDDKTLRGNNLLQAKRYQEALTVFQEIIDTNPENHRVYVYAAQAIVGLRNHEEALRYINRALEANPMDSLVYEVGGEINLYLKNWDEALKYFQDAYKLDASSAVALRGMGQVFYQQKQYDEAIKSFRQALKLNHNSVKAYACLAKAYMAIQDQENGVIDIGNDNVRDLIAQGARISIVEEAELKKMLITASNEQIEERIADLKYIIAWLENLYEQFCWKADFMKHEIKSSGRYIIPRGMEEEFEQFFSS